MKKFDKKALVIVALILVIVGLLVSNIWTVTKKSTDRLEGLTSMESVESEVSEITEVTTGFTENYQMVDADDLENVPEYKDIEIPVVETVSTDFYHLTPEERNVVEHIVAGEARGESYDGQRAVAQCILSACLKDGIQPSQVRAKYQYGGWSNDVTQSVKDAVSAVFDRGELVTEEPIMYFYNPRWGTSKFHESQVHIITIGNHKFFKERSK